MAKSHLKRVTPATVNRTVPPRRLPNGKLRTREYLTEAEVERLMKAAKGNRHGNRDAAMILAAYRHGLRASELVDLRWDRSILPRPLCTFAGSSRARRAPIRSSGMNCARCDAFCASRSRGRRLYSLPSGEHRSARLA